MVRLISLEVEAPPDTVNIAVDYYDNHERALLLATPASSLLQHLPATLVIPTPDLCAYYLYYKLRDGIAGFSNHHEIAKHWREALCEFNGQFEFTGTSIRLLSASGSSRGTTERIGESIGLSV